MSRYLSIIIDNKFKIRVFATHFEILIPLQILKPVGDALDLMQAEKNMFMGMYSPTIITLLNRLENIKGLKFCNVLKTELHSSITNRFKDIFDREHLKAAILNPFFKDFSFS